MNESEENSLLEDKSFSLIDVCLEDDDTLFVSPTPDPQFLHFSDDRKEHKKTVQVLGVQDPGNSLERDEQAVQQLESLEQEETRKKEKYNLRKSLAWDSAFFTSAGVLEPDELSSIIEGAEKGERKHVLPGIEEDIRRSTESVSTFTTDCSTLGTLEDDLFGDIRASIQKSSKASNSRVSQSPLGSGADESKLAKSSEKVDHVSQNMDKLKTKAALKKPSVITKGSGKMANQVSSTSSGQTPKPISRNVEATFRPVKPPKIVGRPSTVLATAAATKRASLGLSANHVKGEKDNAKKLTVQARGARVSAIGGSRITVPKPVIPVKSSSHSSVASKKQLTTSSSTDSLESLSSDSSSIHSLNIVKRKINPKVFSTGSTVKTTLRTASSKNQSMSAHTSPYLKSVTKLSSTISPTSSISEWSSESLSPTSTLNKRSNSSRPSFGSASQVLDSQNHPSDKCSVGHGNQVTILPSERVKRVSTGSGTLALPDSIKPSGLRMPSPKIGFFDGVRSAVRTPGRNSQSHLTVPNDLLRSGAANVTPSGESNSVKPGKLQPARPVVRGAKMSYQQPASEFKPKSPLPPQESSNAVPNVCIASRNGKDRPGTTLKAQSRSPNFMAEKIAPKQSDTVINNPDFGDSLFKGKISSQSKGNAPVKDSGIIPKQEAVNIMLFHKGSEDKPCGQKNDIGAVDIHQKVQPKPLNEGMVVDTSALEGFVKLSVPAPHLTVIEGIKVAEIDNS